MDQYRAADRQQGAAEPLQALRVQSCRQPAGGGKATTGSQCRAADRQQGVAEPLQAFRVQSCRQTAGGSRATTGSHSAELQTDSRGQQSHYRLSVQSCRQTAGGSRATTGSQCRAADRQQGAAEPLQALSAELQTDSRGQQSHYRLSVQSCRQTAGGSSATTGSQCRAADRQRGAAVPLQALSAELQTDSGGQQCHYRLSVQSCRQTAGGSRATTGSQCRAADCLSAAGGSSATTGSHSAELQTVCLQQGAAVPLQALTVQSCRHTTGGAVELRTNITLPVLVFTLRNQIEV
ncbi:hypothetical protein KUCAC02_017852 [Chaenocephalus aceratus]|nr:hypothetical protein KUCAC02_017852 [Chaenocephalus aceratus]